MTDADKTHTYKQPPKTLQSKPDGNPSCSRVIHLRIELPSILFWVWKCHKMSKDCFCVQAYTSTMYIPPRKELLLQVKRWPWEITPIVPRLHMAWKGPCLSGLWEHAALPHSAPEEPGPQWAGSSNMEPGSPDAVRGSTFKQWRNPKEAKVAPHFLSGNKLFWKRHSNPTTFKYKNVFSS